MADVEQKAIAVRQNMERLRALRRGTEETRTPGALPVAGKQRKETLSR